MQGLLNKIFTRDKKIKLEFCQSNLEQFLDQESFSLFTAFFSEEKVFMKEYKCLSHCELCKQKPYAKVNGDIISADNAKELLIRLKDIKSIAKRS